MQKENSQSLHISSLQHSSDKTFKLNNHSNLLGMSRSGIFYPDTEPRSDNQP